MKKYIGENSFKKLIELLQGKYGNVENKSSETIRSELTKSNVTTALGYTPYTPSEIDNKFSTLETNIDWKESVATFDDIATTYPSPSDGWTVNVKDTDYTYRYDGSSWVVISANAIPKSTDTVDGLMSKEDHVLLTDATSKKHTHSNKTVIDGITSALVTAWNSAVTHISDTVKHITSDERTLWNTVSSKADNTEFKTHTGDTDIHITATERTNWNDANSKKHTHSNKSVLDGITAALVTAWNSAVTHISDTVKHITSDERTLWNTVSNKVDKVDGKALSTNDLTDSLKSNYDTAYTHSQSAHSPSNAERNVIVSVKKNGTALSIDGNRAVDVTVPTKVSELENDAKYITGITVDTALSSTSSNPVENSVVKAALDGKANTSHTHKSDDIVSLDSGKLTGTIDVGRLPKGALNKLVTVADDTARFALTTDSVHTGDTVKVTSTGKMYYVSDETNLSSEKGYEVYSAGSATSVPWSGITDKPSTYTPSSHTHTKSQITDFPTIPTVNNPTITITQNGTSKGTFNLNQSGATTIALTDNNTTYSTASSSSNGLMSSTDKSKLDGIAEKANNYSLPTATDSVLGGVKIGSNITNSSGTISLTKTNVTNALGYTPPTTNTTYSVATTSANGLMSSTDKSKLDGIAENANNYSLPTATDSVLGGVKVGSNITNSSGTISLTKANITTALGYTPPTTNTTYSLATSSSNGLMSSADKAKLDGLSENDSGSGITYSGIEPPEITEDMTWVQDGSVQDIVGLQVDYTNKTFTRLENAVGKSQGADFDQYTMFGGRMRCNVADDGTINAWYGDSGYTEDGSNGQVMVYQPKFYYKVCPLELEANSTGIGYHLRKANYYVSSLPHTGFKVHPAFIDANGKEVDYYLDSAYEASIYDTSASAYLLSDEQVADFTADKLCSIAGAKPASGVSQNLTRPNVEALAQVRGTNWHGDLIKQVSARQLLMIIEAGTMNTQTAYGQGVVNIPWTTGSDTTSSYAAATGSTASLGNASGRASETTTYEGGTATKYTIDGKTSVSWRGSENCWGNIWKFVYGINIYGNGSMGSGQPYICTDYTFAESKNSDNYEGAGFTATNANGYISAMGYSESYDWLFIASECSGNSSLPVGDYNYVTSNLSGYRIAPLGGSWNGGSGAGGFCWSLIRGVGFRYRNVGARLVFMPTYGSTSYTTAIKSWKTKMG